MNKIWAVAAILPLLPFSAHGGGPPPDNSWDIAVIDRALATAKRGDRWIKFGDVGVTAKTLRLFRERLVAEQQGNIQPR